ncbi:MAG: benzoate-CoA ligase family protein [Xanthobacteraceae bacterium]|nr:benzoate-CoA ligase family protein [Xanthobacteraceae bacterium]
MVNLATVTERRGYNAASDFVDANVVAGRGNKVAFKEGNNTLTYGALQKESCRFASGLAALGFRHETRIVVLALDTIEFPIAFWGAIRGGVIPIPLNTLLSTEQYAYMIEDSRAPLLLVSEALAKTVEPALPKMSWLKAVIVIGDKKIISTGGIPVYSFEEVVAKGKNDLFTAPTLSDEVAFWLYSSGSTGAPKGTKHVHSSLLYTAKSYASQVLGIREDDVVYSAAKLFFAYGLGNAMTFPMSVGATTVLLSGRPTPDSVFEIIKNEQPSIFCGVPTLYAALIADKRATKGAGSAKLRMCVSAGEALPQHVGENWKKQVGVDILDGIGSTEMLHIFLSNRPDEIRYGTSGKPVPGYDAKILDENGKECGVDEIGELVVRGASAAEGYWNQREKSRRTFAGEWTYTGDKYVRDADGFLRCCGRTDDMFKVSGIWVSPVEVEAALISHEAVLEAAVIGHEDSDGLLKPKAYIVLKQGFSSGDALFESLKAHVKDKAGAWKYPRWIDVKAELPKTATGKIQRFKLREEDAGTSA